MRMLQRFQIRNEKARRILGEICIAFLVFSVLFFNIECFFFMYSDNRTLKVGTVAIMGGIGIGALLYCLYKKKLKPTDFIWPIVLAILIGLSALVNLDFAKEYSYKVLLEVACILFAFIVLKATGIRPFFRWFCLLLLVLSIWSTLITLLYFAAPSIFSFLPTLTNYIDAPFKFILLCVVPMKYYDFPRNYMIFREPGVSIIYLVIACLWQIKELGEAEGKKLIKPSLFFAVFTITIISTVSTTGVFALAIVLVMFLITLTKKSRKAGFGVIGALALILIILISIGSKALASFWENFFWKLTTSNDSLTRRLIAPVANIMLMFSHPLTGVGWTNSVELLPMIGHYFGMQDTLTNMSTYTLAGGVHGIPYFVLLLCGTFFACKRLFPKSLDKAILAFIVLQIIFFGEDMTCSPLLYIVTSIGLNDARVRIRGKGRTYVY